MLQLPSFLKDVDQLLVQISLQNKGQYNVLILKFCGNQECTVRLVGERIMGKCEFTVENSSWLLRLFATFSFVNLFWRIEMSLIELQTASAGNLNIERAQAPAGPSVPGQLVAQSLLQFNYLLVWIKSIYSKCNAVCICWYQRKII